eukprot:m.196369 g.196369  ORF g.196369 m.196369 type:complete len:116 (+) comp39530_c0_seq74:807-1154(+)
MTLKLAVLLSANVAKKKAKFLLVKILKTVVVGFDNPLVDTCFLARLQEPLYLRVFGAGSPLFKSISQPHFVVLTSLLDLRGGVFVESQEQSNFFPFCGSRLDNSKFQLQVKRSFL